MDIPLNFSVIRLTLLLLIIHQFGCAQTGGKPMDTRTRSIELARQFVDQCFNTFTFSQSHTAIVRPLWKKFHVRIYYYPPEIMYQEKQIQNINPGSYSCSLEKDSEPLLDQIDIWPFLQEIGRSLSIEFKDYEGHKGPSYHPTPFIGRGKGAFYYDADGSNLKYIWQRKATSKAYNQINMTAAISFEMIVYPKEFSSPQKIIQQRRQEKDYERRLSFSKVKENRIWFHERNKFISNKLRDYVDNNAMRATNNFILWTKRYIARTGTQKFPKRFSLKNSPVSDICRHYNGYWYYQTYRCDFSLYQQD